MAYSGAQTDYSVDGFKVAGTLYSRYPELIEQNAGRTTPLAKYTIMGKKSVTVPTTGTLTGTGNGTMTAVSAAGPLKVGTYLLACTFAVTNGGVFKLTDPSGNIVASNLTLRVGAGLLTTFVAGGLKFTITDGSTDFAAADSFAVIVASNSKYVPLDPAGLDGSGKFAGIYMGDTITAAALVAGDVTAAISTNGDGAIVSADKLVFENSAALTTLLPSGKTLREEMAALSISVADRYDFDHVQA